MQQQPQPLRCTRCGAMNDPFASVCHACGARNAFGPSAYADEPVAAPPTKRSPMSASAMARWALAVGVVLFGARTLFWAYMRAQRQHPIVIEPITLPTTSATSTKLPPALAAKLPPARRFAFTSDGRAVAFDGTHLKVHTSGGASHEVSDAAGPFAPRADSPITAIGDVVYWVVGDSEIASVPILDWKPSIVLKGMTAIGALASDAKSLWLTATDGKERKLYRLDTNSSKPVRTASWTSTRTSEIIEVTETDVFVVEPSSIVRVAKSDGKATPLATLGDGEEVGAIATSDEALYFTIGSRDLYRVPFVGGERTKVMTSAGAIGDIAVSEHDVVIADRVNENASWQVDQLPGGEVAQITIVASDVGRQPRLHASTKHVAWSTAEGVAFGDAN